MMWDGSHHRLESGRIGDDSVWDRHLLVPPKFLERYLAGAASIAWKAIGSTKSRMGIETSAFRQIRNCDEFRSRKEGKKNPRNGDTDQETARNCKSTRISNWYATSLCYNLSDDVRRSRMSYVWESKEVLQGRHNSGKIVQPDIKLDWTVIMVLWRRRMRTALIRRGGWIDTN